jgi:transcriptional regulator with XRE-family HTH domain
MKKEFGELLRRLRVKADRSMGQVARQLGVSVTYISDVERGKRAPLRPERIEKVAKYLNADPADLLDAAGRSRGVFELDAAAVSPKAREVGAALMRGWPGFSDDKLEKIAAAIKGTED